MDKIKWDSLFDFSGDSPLKELVKQLDDALNKSKQLADVFGGNLGAVMSDLEAVKEKARGMAESLRKANLDASNSGEALTRAAQGAEALTTEFGALVAVEKEQKKVMSALSAGITELETAKEGLAKVNTTEAKSINDLKKQLLDEEKAIKASKTVKDEQIKRIAELSKEYNTATKSLNDAKKGVILINGSYAELNQRVNQAKKELKEMGDGFDDTNPKVAALKKFIKEGSDQLKVFDKSLGDNQRNVGNYDGAISNLKDELKAARNEMVGIAATLGAESPEFAAAAAKAGKLKDELNDINDAIKNTEASPFQNLSSSLGDVGSKLASLDFEGAATAARQLAAASKQITFGELSKSASSFGSTMVSLGRTLLTNPIFIIAGTIGLIVAAFMAMKDAAARAFESTISGASRMIAKLEEQYDLEIKLAQIRGEETFALERKKQQAIIETAKKAIKAAGDIYETDYWASVQSLSIVKKVSEEKLKVLQPLWKSIKEAETEITIINAQEAANQLKIQKEQTKELNKDLEERLKARMKMIEATVKAAEHMFAEHTKEELQRSRELQNKLGEQRLKDIQDSADKEFAIVKASIERTIQLSKTQEQIDYEIRQQNLMDLGEALQDALNIYDKFYSALSNLSNAFTAVRMENLGLELKMLEDNYREEIRLAGDNKGKKEQLDKEYSDAKKVLEAEILEEKKKQASFDKALALFNAALQESLLIIKALLVPSPENIAAAIAGGLQVAAIAITPIPKYEKGTRNSEEGLAVVNEKGPELIEQPGMKPVLYDTEGPALTYLRAGSVVHTADETARLMEAQNFDRMTDIYSGASKSVGGRKSQSGAGVRAEGGFNDARIVEAIKEQKFPDIVKSGSDILEVWTDRQGNKKVIRSKSMGL